MRQVNQGNSKSTAHEPEVCMVPPVLEFVPHIRYKTEEAAAMLAVSPSYLRKLRTKGGGPKFQQMNDTNCYYTYEDLKAWSDSLPKFSNNSEYQAHKQAQTAQD